ncbi:hypothetical protein [Roseibium album]|uniref:hypothetical protein n=1 Tax=Roseibium album TaxID=311410 RepID=UPI002492E0DD|nr:hypothetical protein [Roseibium album]
MSHLNPTFFELLSSEPTREVALPEETLLQDVSGLLSDPSGLVRFCAPEPERLGFAAWRFCDSSSSDCLRLLTDAAVPIETKLSLTGGLKTLFAELFDPHCDPVLQHSLEPGQYLNMACAMFWDIAPLGPHMAGKAGIAPACADVMRFQLTLANPACRESALSGVEQWIGVEPELMKSVLETCDFNDEPVEALRKRASGLA